MADLAALAERLDDAARRSRAVAQLAEPLGLDAAYGIQALSVARRYARGERRVGVKMGFTSRAKMVQMGLSEMIWGRLTDGMLVDDGATIDLRDYVHPRVEPEIAFLMKTRLAGRFTMPAALAAVEAVAPALEIIDSRYENFRFSLTDVVADNTSSSGFVVGPWGDPHTDVANLGMLLEIDGLPVQIGSSAAVLEHPVRALVAAARLVAQYGEALEPGDIILSGGATAAEPLAAGKRVRLTVERLGSVGFGVRGL
jgi:2-oxo-3-hexenedioate decarboxylase